MDFFVIFIFLNFIHYRSCLNYLSKLCNITTYYSSYESTLKISDQMPDLFSECIDKNATVNNKQIFIFNYSNYESKKKEGFNNSYQNLATAFENESKILSKYLFSSLTIVLERGNHIINDDDFFSKYEELFRRVLINITLTSQLSFETKVYMRTNKFFLFIHSSLTIENLHFYGNDINLGQYTKTIHVYCQEEDFQIIYDPLESSNKKDCHVKNRPLIEIMKIKNYGFINLEDHMDNNIDLIPKIIVTNCTFNNFYPYNKDGFLSLISISPFNGVLEISNTIIQNSFFPQALIYFSKYNYDNVFAKLNVGSIFSYYILFCLINENIDLK